MRLARVGMAALDFAKGGVVCTSEREILANRETGTHREPRHSRTAFEIGGTFLMLMLIALGVLAARFVLVLAYGIPR
jgi:hypothetical protein